MGIRKSREVNAVIAIIGGDDSVRILDHVDTEVLRKNPKIFMGYSIQRSHLQCFQAGLVSVYGPSFMAGFAENGGLFDYMKSRSTKLCLDNNTGNNIK